MTNIEEQSEIERREKAEIVGETATIAWNQLEIFYARGEAILVDKAMDLIQVAHAISIDETQKVETWIAEGKLKRQFDEEARNWSENQSEVWAVVIKPWVLVQEIRKH